MLNLVKNFLFTISIFLQSCFVLSWWCQSYFGVKAHWRWLSTVASCQKLTTSNVVRCLPTIVAYQKRITTTWQKPVNYCGMGKPMVACQKIHYYCQKRIISTSYLKSTYYCFLSKARYNHCFQKPINSTLKKPINCYLLKIHLMLVWNFLLLLVKRYIACQQCSKKQILRWHNHMWPMEEVLFC